MASYFIAQGADKLVPGSGDADKSMMVYKWNVVHANGLARIEDASHYLWDKGFHTKDDKFKGDEAETTFEDLSRSEKLGLIELHLKQVEKDLAAAYNITSQVDAVRETAIEENETKYTDSDV